MKDDLEGIIWDLIEIIFRDFFGRTEEATKYFSQDRTVQ
jgi:hypothetical protein